MMLRTIFALEFRYQLRQAPTWLYFGALLVLAFLIVTANFLSDAQEGYFLLNAPIVLASVAVVSSNFWLVIGASVAGEAAARDVQTRMYLLTYPTPTSKAVYLGGRFGAALLLNGLILSAVPLGILLGMYGAGVEAELLGPFRAAAYLSTFGCILLPNAFFATATQFSAATLSRRAIASYLGATALLAIVYLLSFALHQTGEWQHLVDPMGFSAVMSYQTKWSPLERTTRLVLSENLFLLNRLLWFGASLGLLALTYARFQLVLPETGRKPRPDQPPVTDTLPRNYSSWGTAQTQPPILGMYGVATQVRQLRFLTGEGFRHLATSKSGLPLLALLALLTGFTLPGNLKGRGTPLLPRTDVVLHQLTAPLTEPKFFGVLIAVLIIFYAGELVWREREAGLSDIADATPVPEWVLFTSCLLVLGLMIVSWVAFLMVAGLVGQAALGGPPPEIGLYLHAFFGLQLADYLLFALLTLTVHGLVNQKFVGHLVALLAYGFIAFGTSLGVEHKLLIFTASPGWTYTDMAGFGPTLVPWLWFKAYWVAWALLLAVVAVLFWVRNRENGPAARLKLARGRFTGAVPRVAATAVGGVLVFGGYVFYNTNVRHEYLSAATSAAQRAAYEQRYGRYRNAVQPRLTGVKLQVEIYPQQQSATIRGTYQLVNKSGAPIDSVHLATGTGAETAALAFDRPARALLVDAEQGYHMYALTEPLRPGDSLQLSFEVRHQVRGFSNDGADQQMQANGSSFRNLEWLPVLGYQPYRELDEAGLRKAYGLAPRPVTNSLYDVAARRYAPFAEQIAFEATIGTDADQTAVAPGTLRRTWARAGRRYFQYATESPIRNEYAIFSARYALQEGRWRNPAASLGQEVAIQVFYPPGVTGNPGRMIRSARASLDFYSQQFGPYPHRQLRFVTHPGYSFGHHAAPIDITAEEGFFLLNPKADKRGFDLVTAVVAHEVAHQWWGNQLKQAYVEGAGLITESLAWYSAMGVVEDNYGPEHLRRLLDFLREENETPRTRAAQPLLQANDWYQNYRKGPLALYALSQYAGRNRVNGALQNLLAHHRPGTLPYPTSLDLYRELQTATPDSLQPLLRDLFKTNTFWELATQNATARPLAGGAWQVQLTVQARKLKVDSAGTETPLPLQDWVEVGVFGPTGPGSAVGRTLYRQRHRLRTGQQTIVVTVPGKPALAGVDPRLLLVDWKPTDNIRTVHAAN
ncbi:M1 family aminopeptidase [Hymenobacter sp. UYP22]|uniref:ABC transporter permease/M1 family aminopeptidase n=1 Tax=Hymenobacter sp. UYP22 TaxID=3156348 RepID=UPI003392769F